MGIRASLLAFKPGQAGTGPCIDSLDMDKSWHGLHYLLSDSAEPIDGAAGFLLNGEEVPDIGDGEVFTHTAAEVAEFSKLLSATTAIDLLGRYDSERMRGLELYPQLAWDQQDFDYLLEYYNALRPFIQRHAEFGHELMVMIC